MNPTLTLLVLALSTFIVPATHASTIATGGNHTCSIVNNEVWCWGSNEYGQLQVPSAGQCSVKRGMPAPTDVTIDCSQRPVKAASLSSDVKISHITAGGSHTCALAGDKALCWGRNNNGQLGDDQRSHQGGYKPVVPKGLDKGVTHIAANGDTTCAVVENKVYCWGAFHLARYLRKMERCEPVPGSNTAGWGGADQCRKTPLMVDGFPADKKVLRVAVGFNRACAILEGGSLWCWGEGIMPPSGQNQRPEQSVALKAEQMPGAASGVTSVAPSMFATFAVLNNKVVYWGADLHTGRNSYKKAGAELKGLPDNAKARSVVISFAPPSTVACASLEDGTVWCWGADPLGGLGNGTNTQLPDSPFKPIPTTGPVKVSNVGAYGGATELASGHGHTCIDEDGAFFCWGKNDVSQLGNGFTGNSNVPVEVYGLPEGEI